LVAAIFNHKSKGDINMNINWKQKLTSRKFWAAVVGFVTSLLLGFGIAESDITQVTSIIMAGASLIAYIIGEGLVDAQRVKESKDE
jgi:uncharacterized membrane protein